MNVATKYGVYFRKDGITIRLPVNPEELPIEYPTENNRYNVLDLGEIVVPRTPKLRQVSFEGVLPGDPDDPLIQTVGGFKPPEFYINFFKECQDKKEPLRFIANRYHENGGAIFDTNIQVIIEDFDAKEKGGETGDFYYTISLSEYRDFAPQKVNIVLPKVSASPAKAVATPQREVPNNVINVGDEVIANGKYWYSSWGAKPFGTANNKRIKVTRIIQNPTKGQDYPVLIGVWGWVKMDQLRKA